MGYVSNEVNGMGCVSNGVNETNWMNFVSVHIL